MECNANCLKWDKNSKWDATGNFISSNNETLNSTIEAFGCACQKNNELLKLKQDIDEDEKEWFTPLYLHEKIIENFETKEKQSNNWEHNEPKKVLENIVNMGFNIPPNYLPNKGGLVIWKKHQMPSTLFGCKNILEELMIKDELIPMKCPHVRNDYLYTSINIDLSPIELSEIQMISGSFTFDTIKKLLTARFNNLEGTIILLKLAVDLVCKNITIKQIQNEKRLQHNLLQINHDGCIKSTYNNMVSLLDALKGNLDNEGYWRGAFNNNCQQPNPYDGYNHGNLYSVYK